MVKKLLNPLVVSAFILVLLLGSLAHLMYGSCQTTKYHYMCQAYWMPDNLPEWMLNVSIDKGLLAQKYDPIKTSKGFTGTWVVWDRKGFLKLKNYYNEKGDFISYDLFKKGRFVKRVAIEPIGAY